MTAVASGTVIVISKIEMPPASTASAARIASSGDGARTTGTMPTVSTRMQMSAAAHRSILRSGALHRAHHLGERRHGGVAGRRHRQRAVRDAALERPLRILAGEQPVDEPGRERIAAADAIEDLDVPLRDLVERPLVPADGAPAVDRRRARRAQRGRDGLDVGVRGDDVVDHRAKARRSAATGSGGRHSRARSPAPRRSPPRCRTARRRTASATG